MIVRGGRPGLLSTMARTAGTPATSGTATQGPAAVDVVGEIKQLADLKAAGALTDEEFAAAKTKLLG